MPNGTKVSTGIARRYPQHGLYPRVE